MRNLFLQLLKHCIKATDFKRVFVSFFLNMYNRSYQILRSDFISDHGPLELPCDFVC